MPQVDFYILNVDAVSDAGHFPCRLTEKAYQAGFNVLISTNSAQESKLIDDLLWSFNQGSFLPHNCVEEDDAPAELPTPILISHDEQTPERDVLINLKPKVPNNPESYQRIAELVYDDEVFKQAARTRYRHYQQLGYEVKSHEIRI